MAAIHQCRRGEAPRGGEALPFVLPGARATFTPGARRQRAPPAHRGRARLRRRRRRRRVHADAGAAQRRARARGARRGRDDRSTRSRSPTARRSTYSYDGKQARVRARRRASRAKRSTWWCATAARRAAGSTSSAPTRRYPKRPLQAWSQGQDEDNRAWFPCFDHPTEKSTSEVIATVPAQMTRAVERHAWSADEVAGERAHRPLPAGRAALELPRHAGRRRVRAPDAIAPATSSVHYFVNPGREADAPRTFGNTAEDDRAVRRARPGANIPARATRRSPSPTSSSAAWRTPAPRR